MKTYTPEERLQNILSRATELGYTTADLEKGMCAEGYIIEHATNPLHELYEGSYINWSDGMGYTYVESRRYIKTEWWRNLPKTEILLDFAVNSEGRLVELYEKRTFDVMYNKGESINDEKFHESYMYCLEFIKKYNGTGESYFPQYIGGDVIIFCYETEQTVYTEKVLSPQSPDLHRIEENPGKPSILKRLINLWGNFKTFLSVTQ